MLVEKDRIRPLETGSRYPSLPPGSQHPLEQNFPISKD